MGQPGPKKQPCALFLFVFFCFSVETNSNICDINIEDPHSKAMMRHREANPVLCYGSSWNGPAIELASGAGKAVLKTAFPTNI